MTVRRRAGEDGPPGPGWLTLAVEHEGMFRYRWTIRTHHGPTLTGTTFTRDGAARKIRDLIR